MLISGLQKLTLLDFPGCAACTVFTGGCNFRCPFCHNASLVLPEKLSLSSSADDVLSFLKKRVGLLDGVAVTGGEPLLHSDIDDFLKAVRDLGYKIKLDTNGSFPGHLRKIVEAGLVDYVAMDIKNSPELYPMTIGIPGFDISPVNESKEYLLSGAVDFEFRTTTVKGLHSEESLVEAAGWISGADKYFLQQYKDSGDVILSEGLSAFDEQEMLALKEAVSQIIPGVSLRGV
ncbi:MAG: anaerobic ribonucleoside-triphosphate reductase activating protein [Eubacteriales bacterium]|nr:anaerobic ribonucleoside-triphosphate reductase activating protein [Eubacteriales bacterium]